MTNDSKFFNDALLAYAYRTSFDGRFTDLPIEEQRIIINDAQTLKTAQRIIEESIKYQASQPMYPGESL